MRPPPPSATLTYTHLPYTTLFRSVRARGGWRAGGGTEWRIGYVTLGTDDLDRARAFYDALLGTIGARRLIQFPDEDGGFTMYGTGMDRPAIVVTRDLKSTRLTSSH